MPTGMQRLSCYYCDGRRLAAFGSAICDICRSSLRAAQAKAPDHPVCGSCGYRFINDWERVKHEIVGTHEYRAWTGRPDR